MQTVQHLDWSRAATCRLPEFATRLMVKEKRGDDVGTFRKQQARRENGLLDAA